MGHLSDSPLVSVIMPVFNGEKYLCEAIESIVSQTYHHLEVIVVDDGSTDGSSDIVESFHQVQYLFQDNAGHAAARNRGIRAAKGEYIAFLDADDLWMPEKLTLQMAAFNADAELDIVTGYVKQFISPDVKADIKGEKVVATPCIPGYSPIAILVKRDLFGVVGLFHEELKVGEAISWFARVLECKPKMKVLPDLVAMRRIHGNNHSIQHQQEKDKAIMQILKASLDRRRGGI
ncbi:MAG: glycosyltransferase family 2 protein [Chloroflexi bacterium]|nr:glycosyltransferase family 2 protein [Chloroflexota bacterium]